MGIAYGAGCERLDHVEVSETSDAVSITVHVRRWDPCAGALSAARATATLRSPLGARRLDGACEPSETSTVGRECTYLQAAAEGRAPLVTSGGR